MKALLSRFAQTIFVLWVVATVLFLMFRLMPGDPTAAYIDTTFTEEQQLQLKAMFGLDQPLWKQYLLFISNAAHGEFGQSFHHRRPVVELMMEVLPNTIVLTLSSIIVAYVFGVLVGAWLAWNRGNRAEVFVVPTVLALRAAPEFWLGMVLLATLGFGLGWFPSGGANEAGATYESEWSRLFSVDFLHHLALPALTLALYLQGLPLLLMRSNMLDVMQEDFVMMARMKGLPEWVIVLKHAARNALLPVMTAFAIGVGQSIGANVVVESVFSWPGLGRLLVASVAASDYPVAQGAFLLIATVLVTMNFIADMLYSVLDPRVSHGSRR